MTARRHTCDECGGRGHTFRAAWPIEDDSLTKAQAIDQARPLLLDLLFEAGAVQLGAPDWHLEIYGDATWLCASMPAAPWIDTYPAAIEEARGAA